MDRRSALQTLLVMGGAAALESCTAKRVSQPSPALAPNTTSPLKLPKVNVHPDREIRTVVGLRPFRPSGFVVRAQKFDEKIVVHNYGHGGGGVTLSWGTAELACREVDASGEKGIAVLGCGAVGLATARLLQERGCTVTIYAKDLPPNTTSNIAGAQWLPAYVFRRDHIAPGFMPQFVEACHIANRRYQLMVGPRYGVRWLPNFWMDDEPLPSGGLLSPDGPLRDLYPEMHYLDTSENPFPFPLVLQFDTMIIEPNRYLPAVMDDFHLAGGRIVVRELREPAELPTLSERVVVNCSGLGAKALFGDEELTPIKGQLTVLLPQSEIDYCTIPPDLYMFPRGDGILLGGTHEEGVWSLEPNLEAKQRILTGHARIFQQMK